MKLLNPAKFEDFKNCIALPDTNAITYASYRH